MKIEDGITSLTARQTELERGILEMILMDCGRNK